MLISALVAIDVNRWRSKIAEPGDSPERSSQTAKGMWIKTTWFFVLGMVIQALLYFIEPFFFSCSFGLTQKNQKLKANPIAPRILPARASPKCSFALFHIGWRYILFSSCDDLLSPSIAGTKSKIDSAIVLDFYALRSLLASQ
jgi:hypothetical protein